MTDRMSSSLAFNLTHNISIPQHNLQWEEIAEFQIFMT